MIVTTSKPYGIIKGMLKKWKKIGIVSCNCCARACETGGRKKMEQLAERLRNDGYDVLSTDLIPMTCNINLAKKPKYEADTLIVLACDSGVYTLQDLFPEKTIVAANNTVGIGAKDKYGNIFQMVTF
jgi:hypothetical protein